MSWGSNAIFPDNAAGVKNAPAFNHEAVGVGKAHENIARRPYQLMVELEILAFGGLYDRWFQEFSYANCRTQCLIDTANAESFFLPGVATALSIDPPAALASSPDTAQEDEAFFEPVFTPDGYLWADCWFRHKVGIIIGPAEIGVIVRFPLQWAPGSGNSFILRQGLPPNSICSLGMAGVLDHRMLCLTPQTVFALARLR